jgi:hypothetical protein
MTVDVGGSMDCRLKRQQVRFEAAGRRLATTIHRCAAGAASMRRAGASICLGSPGFLREGSHKALFETGN